MSLIHYWRCEGGNGSEPDVVGTNNLTNVGGVTSVAGKKDNARSFSGGQYLTGTPFGNNPFTLWTWFNSSLSAVTTPIIESSQNGFPSWYLTIANNQQTFVLYKDGSNHNAATLTTSLASNFWHFIAIKHDPTNKLLYISMSGLPFTSQSYSYSWSEDSNNLLRLGGTPYSQYFGSPVAYNGGLDEIAVFDELLSDSDIQSYYNMYNAGGGIGSFPYSGSINSQSIFLPLSLSLSNPVESAPSYTKFLTKTINIDLDWLLFDPDEGTIQQELGSIQPSHDFDANQAWYDAIAIQPTSTYTLDLTDLPLDIFGMHITRGFSSINQLTIENTSSSSNLQLGSSGITNSVTQFGTLSEIGYSGVADITSDTGFTVDFTHKNLGIKNPTTSKVTCKILILGSD